MSPSDRRALFAAAYSSLMLRSERVTGADRGVPEQPADNRAGSRRPFASRSFVITEQPAGAQVAQIVAAFGTADDALARDVVAWALAAVSQAPATPEPDSPTASAH